jgi:uncharacterized protein (DUF1501 family)
MSVLSCCSGRRAALRALTAASLLPFTWRTWAAPAAAREGRLVFVLLRGGLDGLHAISPVADPRWPSLRPTLAQPVLQSGLTLPGSGFALHPALADCLTLYRAGELWFCPTAGSPNTSRSHFQAQDVMELGTGAISGNTGWMGRLASQLDGRLAANFAANAPLALYGAGVAIEHIPLARQALRLPGGALQEALLRAHAGSPSQRWLQQAIDTQALLAQADPDQASRNAAPLAGWAAQARQMGQVLRQQPELALAFVDLSGVDSHVNQAAGLAQPLTQLGQGLLAMKTALGEAEWARTRVVVLSEFGRTAAENGTRGTDHGHGGLALLAGGGLGREGRMLGDFAGLQANALFEGRDLPVTLDWRSLLAAVSQAVFGLSARALDQVFPGRPAWRAPWEGSHAG